MFFVTHISYLVFLFCYKTWTSSVTYLLTLSLFKCFQEWSISARVYNLWDEVRPKGTTLVWIQIPFQSQPIRHLGLISNPRLRFYSSWRKLSDIRSSFIPSSLFSSVCICNIKSLIGWYGAKIFSQESLRWREPGSYFKFKITFLTAYKFNQLKL